MKEKELIISETEDLPSEKLYEVLDFIKFIKHKYYRNPLEILIGSENTLKKDWMTSEEQEAWNDL